MSQDDPRPRRIMVLSPYPPPPDGIGAHTRILAREWLASGHDVHVLSRRVSGNPPAEAGLQVHRVLSSSRRSAVVARALVRDLSPDLLLVQFAVPALGSCWPAGLSALAQAQRSGVPTVIAYHEVTRELDLLRGPGRWLYSWIADHAAGHVAFSPEAASALTRFAGVPVTVLPLGVPELASSSVDDLTGIKERYGVDGGTILSFGFTHPDKGTDVLVRAAALLARQGAPIRLLIAGSVRSRSGPFKIMEALDHRFSRRVMDEAHGVPGVTFCGFVPDEDLPHLLRSVGALALPYRKITQSGVAGLALAAGLPSVASDLPGLSDALGRAALYSPPGDVRLLAAQLRRLAEPETRQCLAGEARVRAREMSFARVAESLLRVAAQVPSGREGGVARQPEE